jgi:hypothetical protein
LHSVPLTLQFLSFSVKLLSLFLQLVLGVPDSLHLLLDFRSRWLRFVTFFSYGHSRKAKIQTRPNEHH